MERFNKFKDKTISVVEGSIGSRGYGLFRSTTSRMVGKQTSSTLRAVGNLAYGSLGASLVAMAASGVNRRLLGMGSTAARVYGTSNSFSGQLGFRNTYRAVNAGVSGIKFSFRGKRLS